MHINVCMYKRVYTQMYMYALQVSDLLSCSSIRSHYISLRTQPWSDVSKFLSVSKDSVEKRSILLHISSAGPAWRWKTSHLLIIIISLDGPGSECGLLGYLFITIPVYVPNQGSLSSSCVFLLPSGCLQEVKQTEKYWFPGVDLWMSQCIHSHLLASSQ